jgi:hypothetical protein
MKNLITIALIIGLFSCKKNDVTPTPPPNGQIVFYQTTNKGTWGLWFQWQYVGKLKYSNMSRHCGDSGFITMDVPPGKYTIDFQSFDNDLWGDPFEITVESGKCKAVGLIETESFPTTVMYTY